MTTEPSDGRAALRIVRGVPTDAELAALTAVVAAIGPAGDSPAPTVAPTRGRWNDPAQAVRRGWAAGPGGWRSAR